MDPSTTQSNPSIEEQEDDWDTDGFVIPSLSIGDSDSSNQAAPEVTDVQLPPKVIKEQEKIYLGPHGAPPSQAKQHQLDLNTGGGRKQRFKQKLNEADRRSSGTTTGRENKVEYIRDLVGSRIGNKTTTADAMMHQASTRDWLDPHCHESQFERYSN
ncbi:uncharacterized protein A4U43_C03F25250 [Asparagus officinalis]|uniref:Uncharacterized protein n=1 Tax=Asparagus officinalis TaxID=4686 RepID=A0A5P1FH46_ASPOF|nr:uncharacterized protein LOC109834377 [Asparagus officinalis]ONK76219.1 uncharacterized protein A4U43_C03F25250 [Asparagus officinalis]